jgi:hypothetical protein
MAISLFAIGEQLLYHRECHCIVITVSTPAFSP